MHIRMDGGYMVLGLTRNQYRFRGLLFVAILCLCFCGCDTNAGKYPFQVSSEWRCDTIECSLSYSTDEDGNEQEDEVLIWENEMLHVNIAFGVGDFCVFPEGSVKYDERLFSGTWNYEGEKLVLRIEEDYLFNYQFSTLEFSALQVN